MTEQEPSLKAVPVQPWNIRIPEWIGQQTDACKEALQLLWERRRKPVNLDRLEHVLPADVADTVRRNIEALARELGWEVCRLMSMLNVYLPGIVDLPRSGTTR